MTLEMKNIMNILAENIYIYIYIYIYITMVIKFYIIGKPAKREKKLICWMSSISLMGRDLVERKNFLQYYLSIEPVLFLWIMSKSKR